MRLRITFDLLCAAVEALDGDTSVPSKRQVRLKHSVLPLAYNRNNLTCPSLPRPILTRTSTRSATTLRLASASMPKIMTAPRLWALGSPLSEPSPKIQPHFLN